MITAYTGRVYRAESGQWSWVVSDHEGPVANGAGYENEEEAHEAMGIEIAEWGGRRDEV